MNTFWIILCIISFMVGHDTAEEIQIQPGEEVIIVAPDGRWTFQVIDNLELAENMIEVSPIEDE